RSHCALSCIVTYPLSLHDALPILAEVSNLAIVVSIVLYVLALIGFSADLASSSQRRSDARLAARERAEADAQAVPVGTAAAPSHGASSPVPGDDVGSEARADGDGSGAPADSAGSLLQAPAAEDAGSGAAARSMSPQTFAFLLSCAAGVLEERGVALRAEATQRVPSTNLYEFAPTRTVLVLLLFLLFSIRRRELRALGPFVVGAILLVLLL